MSGTTDAQTTSIADPVAQDVPGALEIGFDKADHPNCSDILWQNLDRNPDAIAVSGPAGDMCRCALIKENRG
ncbi:hypothetical protein [Maritimibacter alexandrii]|uniref:hypothetical protein n=1 Tax=Maritimibacter alexandrii TaxID=2570355 RepID=UPI00110902A1|nr:hypothetical protein [Maritimibacter alexandrii]